MEHDYDGIREYDNPMPRWWLWTFWATIIWSALYYFNVPGIGIGAGRLAAWQHDVAVADSIRASHNPLATVTEASLLAGAADPATLALGKATFSSMCASCHQADGGGNIGPNLTDDWWIHGGKPMDILKTVDQGVLDKGMPAWGKMLKPDQLTAVVGYVTTLHGTRPKEPKAPQGVRADSAVAP
jgi:cytochrome c oxidase cbb3-type subunit 3